MADAQGMDGEDWKDSPLTKLVIAAVTGAVMTKVVGKVVGKVKEEVRKVDLNNLVKDPKAETAALAERLKKSGKEGIDAMKDDVDYVRKKGLGGILAQQVRRAHQSLLDTVCGIMDGKYALASELRVPGVEGAIIGEYLADERAITRDEADAVRYFALDLLRHGDALPYELGYGADDAAVRQELITDIVGFATTDIDSLVGKLEGIITIDECAFKDDDPTLRRQELAVLRHYAEGMRAVAARYSGSGDGGA